MLLSFNTAGPCLPGEHYMLPPERRLGRVMRLIEQRKFFTLHAGRQTGKTTCAMWIADHLNATGAAHAVYVDLEVAREQPEIARAMTVILDRFNFALSTWLPALSRPAGARIAELLRVPETAVLEYLGDLARGSDRPLVVLFDEADGLVGAAMVSFLTQLRDGYIGRSRSPFPSSVVLIGQRQVRDYVLAAEERKAVSWLGTTSPFNITAEAPTLGSFSGDEVAELLSQHTAATGQRFEPGAVERIAALTCGHPWLVNAIADRIVEVDVPDRAVAVTAAHVDAAKETLIIDRRSHIDSLVARLREERVRKVIDPMLAGEQTQADVLDDDLAYVLGLGLLVMRGGSLQVANPIYREVIPRALTYFRQAQIPAETAWYVRPDGSLDVDKLLAAFQTFWRKDGHLAAGGFGYRESGPHLMLMAFLQRVVNGGGRIEREYGLGRGALDLMIFWKDERHAIEVKLRRDTETEDDALDQVARYLDGAGLPAGWLVLFDLRSTRPWEEKLRVREVEHAGRHIRIVGC